jgi:hypothetical protein
LSEGEGDECPDDLAIDINSDTAAPPANPPTPYSPVAATPEPTTAPFPSTPQVPTPDVPNEEGETPDPPPRGTPAPKTSPAAPAGGGSSNGDQAMLAGLGVLVAVVLGIVFVIKRRRHTHRHRRIEEMMAHDLDMGEMELPGLL